MKCTDTKYLKSHKHILDQTIKKMKIIFKRSILDSLFGYARNAHPREGILLLRGRIERDKIIITDILIPPFATHGTRFSSFPLQTLPIDFSIVGIAHSHPSGNLTPSLSDLNQFYGRIMVIMAFPYRSRRDIMAIDRTGKTLRLVIIS